MTAPRTSDRPGRALADERGAAALSTVVLAAIFLTVAAAIGGAVTDVALAAARARTAADAAALAGAAASPLTGGDPDEDPCAAAARLAEHNEAELTGCTLPSVHPDPDRGEVLRVRVRVSVPTRGPLTAAFPDLTATAEAALLPTDP